MLYTSYYAKTNKIPNVISCISISITTPKWFHKMPKYPKLAPSCTLLNDWKLNKITWEEYTERYIQETLSKLDPNVVLKELMDLVRPFDDDVCMMCYEKTQCHRFIVSDWFICHGIPCKEYDFGKGFDEQW